MDENDQRRRPRHWRAFNALGPGLTAIVLLGLGLAAVNLRATADTRARVLHPVEAAPGPSAPTTASAPPPPTTTAVTAPPPPTTAAHLGLPVTAVGDSLMIDIQPYLNELVPGVSVNGAVSRPWSTGVTILTELSIAGRLQPEVVVGLGANGGVTPAQFDAMMRAVAGAKRVVFVNVRLPRPWQDETNTTLRDGVARYPGTVLADWYTLSADHPSWFAPDGVHLETAGAQAMAGLVASHL